MVIGAGPYGLAAATNLTDRRVEHRAFGTPMGGWLEHMPIGMFLKSTARDSSIGSPHQQMGIGDWCAAAGVEPYDKDGGEIPIPIADFIEYGRWFQEREVSELEQEQVTSVARSRPDSRSSSLPASGSGRQRWSSPSARRRSPTCRPSSGSRGAGRTERTGASAIRAITTTCQDSVARPSR